MFEGFWRELVEVATELFVVFLQIAIITVGSVAVLTACIATAWRVWTWLA